MLASTPAGNTSREATIPPSNIRLEAMRTAFTFFAMNPAAADDRPSSVRDAGANPPTHHEVAPTERAGDARARTGDGPGRTIFGFGRSIPESGLYEVQTPMSVNESAPFAAGNQDVPRMRAR